MVRRRFLAPRKPLDVLANQLAALALETREMGDLEAYAKGFAVKNLKG